MSILFYRRPDYTNPQSTPLNSSDCKRYVDRAKGTQRSIPGGLSFDEIVSGKTLPPCSLSDFMDYLIYVEHNAENLQFYLWFHDYSRRFENLSEKEAALSPEWDPTIGQGTNPTSPRSPTSPANPISPTSPTTREPIVPRRANPNEDAGDLTTFGESAVDDPSKFTLVKNGLVVPPSIAESRISTEKSSALTTGPNGLKWQPFTVQPMRDEINRVMRHYIAFSAPRELNLSHRDRGYCLHALQHTTHPSALLPALKIAEATLRGQSHSNFVRWSICNGNKPRVFYVRFQGILNTFFGFLIAVLLILSHASRWWRIFAAIEWWLGLTTLIAAYKGLCVILVQKHVRNLRPWEQFPDEEEGAAGIEVRHSYDVALEDRGPLKRENSMSDSGVSSKGSRARSPSMAYFGPKNSFDHQSWISKYKQKGYWKKINDVTTYTQDKHLRLLQDRIFWGSAAWGFIITVVLTVGFTAIPKGNFY